MFDLDSHLQGSLSAEAAAWLSTTEARVGRDPAALPAVFPSLARQLGRTQLTPEIIQEPNFIVDFGAWRTCDAGGLALIRSATPDDAQLIDLFLHGDFEERTILLRSLACLSIHEATIQLLGEAQRTNTQVHFEACVCDSDLVARAIDAQLPTFQAVDGYKVLLKAAFVGVRLQRFFGIERHASSELTRMVTGLATEREAAGRPIWADTNRVIARAPIEGSLARIRAGLEHADPEQRLAAAEAVAILGDAELIAAAAARLSDEKRPDIRAALQTAIDSD